MKGDVLCLIGGQYGSEGKGVIAAHIANSFGVHVRVGGPNAGHSFVHKGGLFKMRSLPCGWVNPGAYLVVGAGAILEPDVLAREIRETGTSPSRVVVDERAFLLDAGLDRETNPDSDYSLRRSIGATGEGVGPARLRRMKRGQVASRFARDLWSDTNDTQRLWPWVTGDTAVMVESWRQRGRNVLLEGTQGVHLSLTHGQWPYVTSADTGTAQLLADCGVAPGWGVETLMVIRTFPIRVGGNSGPLVNEITWEQVSRIAGRKVEEFTTVTQRLRRVGLFHAPDVHRSILLNAPSALALMFLDYLYPDSEGVTDWDLLPKLARGYVMEMEQELGVPIRYVGTGGSNFSVVEVPR